jgi:hypothetical protein
MLESKKTSREIERIIRPLLEQMTYNIVKERPKDIVNK